MLRKSFKNLKANIQYGDYYKEIAGELKVLLQKYKEDSKRVVIWGAGLKGNAFLTLVDPEHKYIEAVVDMKESLHGTYLATGHVIVAKEYVISNAVDVVFVMNELFYVDNFFMLEKMKYKGQLFDVDYLVKHKVPWEQIYKNDFEQVDLKDDKLFGYELSDIQYKILDILHEIDKISEKHKITYFLEAGTALGAERYNGFIPCDDDIDIGLLRKDYEKFIEYAEKELPEGFLIQKMQPGSQYPYPYAQVVMDHTCFVRYDFKDLKMHLGIHIDVAPIDNVSEDKELQKKQFDKVRRITKLIRTKMLPQHFNGKNPIKRFIVNAPYYLLKLVPLKVLMHIQWKEFTRYDKMDTGYVGDLCTHYKKLPVFEKDKLIPVSSHQFEDREYPVPGDIDYYLGIMYDDYKKLSPRENGSVKYNLIAVSLEHNYEGEKNYE